MIININVMKTSSMSLFASMLGFSGSDLMNLPSLAIKINQTIVFHIVKRKNMYNLTFDIVSGTQGDYS